MFAWVSGSSSRGGGWKKSSAAAEGIAVMTSGVGWHPTACGFRLFYRSSRSSRQLHQPLPWPVSALGAEMIYLSLCIQRAGAEAKNFCATPMHYFTNSQATCMPPARCAASVYTKLCAASSAANTKHTEILLRLLLLLSYCRCCCCYCYDYHHHCDCATTAITVIALLSQLRICV